ncbi:hypothetical protein AB1L30_00260, partial [Bremerella sp. JC817]|uniref:hypothetical protein n=1 Tax=Bremerella sp. JC817 TaxID=3231756 RepID=UPI00345A56C6
MRELDLVDEAEPGLERFMLDQPKEVDGKIVIDVDNTMGAVVAVDSAKNGVTISHCSPVSRTSGFPAIEGLVSTFPEPCTPMNTYLCMATSLRNRIRSGVCDGSALIVALAVDQRNRQMK